MINEFSVGVVEYLFDRTIKGELQTTKYIEYIFEGQESCYYLDFSAPEDQFKAKTCLQPSASPSDI